MKPSSVFQVYNAHQDLKAITLAPEEAAVVAQFLGYGSVILYGRRAVWVQGEEQYNEDGGWDEIARIIWERVASDEK